MTPISDPPNVAPQPKPRSIFLNPNYLLLQGGQLISVLGSGISSIALPFLILFLTNFNYEAAGIAGAIRALPYLFFSLPAGALIDRWNRKLTMIICDAGRAIALGSIPVALYLHALTITQLYIVTGVEGTLFVFFNIAEIAALPQVVAKEQLPAANGANQAIEILAGLVSSPLGGIIYLISRTIPFIADAVSYVVSVVSLALIRTPFQTVHTAERRPLLKEIGEGVGWLRRQKLVRYMAFLTGSLNLTGAGLFLIVIALLKVILPANQQGDLPFYTGVLITIASVGGILGAILGPTIQKRFSFGSVIIWSLWVQAIAFTLFAFSPNFLVLGVLGAISFLTGPIYNVVQVSYRLALIPDALQGRVNSVFRLLAFGGQPIGLALTGILLQYVDAVTAVLIFGGVNVLIALFTTLNPLVRKARPLAQVEAA